MKRRILIAAAIMTAALLRPLSASAQIDALIDAVVDAVEPTPVYDVGLREATEALAAKIERLNNVLFGGAEVSSAAYRYKTMYSDLYEITTAFTGFVDRSYSNAKRLEAVYSGLDGGGLSDHARAVQATWNAYDDSVRGASRIVARFKKLFSDPNTTNAEVREAAREALAELEKEQAKEDRRIEREIASTELAEGLIECASLISAPPEEYVKEGRQIYGTTISEGGSSTSTGTLGTVVVIIIALLCVGYTVFAGVHIMKGTPYASNMLVRIIFLLFLSIIIILSIQNII